LRLVDLPRRPVIVRLMKTLLIVQQSSTTPM
jgi:hypothetical protein